MDRQFNSTGKAYGLRGRGLPPMPRDRPQENYMNHHVPRPDRYLPDLDLALEAAQLYWATLGAFDQHINRYLTRYHDFYLDRARPRDATAISSIAIRELAEELVRSQPPDEAALRRAAVLVLCENYTRCEMPESSAAKEALLGWARYLNAHLDIKKLPEPGKQEYQNTLAAQADHAATALWQAYRDFHRDPMRWGNEWACQEKQRVQRQLELAGNAAHEILKQRNWPELVEPAPPIPKLRPEACEFLPSKLSATHQNLKSPLPESPKSSDSGYASSSTSFGQQDPPAKSIAHTPGDPPDFANLHETATVDLLAFADVSDNGTVSTHCSGTSDKTPSPRDTKFDSLSSPEISRSIPPSWPSPMNMKQRYNHTILLFSESKAQIPVTALFDSGASGPNWVSREVVETLGRELFIFTLDNESTFLAADGKQLRAQGAVELAWIFPDPSGRYGHVKWRHEVFNVLPSNHIQVIFGADYCRANDLLHFNEQAIHGAEVTPLMPDTTPSDALKQQMADEKRRRDERKRAADAQRVKLEQKFEASSAEKKRAADAQRVKLEKNFEASSAAKRVNQGGWKRL